MRKTPSLADIRLRTSVLSLVVGTLVLLLKFYTYHLTNSVAILSDALESVVNVVSAAFMIYAVRAAQEPPDEEHPYGHGKFEFVTAVFEGGLIIFASFMIAYEAISSMIRGNYSVHFGHGFILVAIAGLANGLLGLHLVNVGKKTNSMALIADGKHVLGDFLVFAGMMAALTIVKFTGLQWLDPGIALLMAIVLASTGLPVVKSAMNGLVDAADPKLLSTILAALEENRVPGFIRAHKIRVMRNGRNIHVDGHLVVPQFWTVAQTHDFSDDLENRLVSKHFLDSEFEFHIDPCGKNYCKICDLEACPIRTTAFVSRPPLRLSEITGAVDIPNLPEP
jgi:cation diffusion facilitator family transporter